MYKLHEFKLNLKNSTKQSHTQAIEITAKLYQEEEEETWLDSGPPRRSVMIGRFDQAELEFDLPGLDTTEPQPYTLDNLIVDAADRALSEETVVGIGDDLPQSGLSGEALKNLPQPSRRDEGLETQLRVTHLVRFQKVFVKHFQIESTNGIGEREA